MSSTDITARAMKRWGLLVALLTIPVAIVVSHFVDPGRGRAAGASVGLMIIAIRAFWYQRRQAWFWVTVAALAVIHVVLIVLVPWTNRRFPAPELWPVGIADFAAMCGVIKLIEKLMIRSSGASSTS
jgi:O-antigen ligase